MYIYAETAFHHEGDITFLKKLISDIATTGCQGIKFQVLTKPQDFFSTNHSLFNKLSGYCFNYHQWEDILQYTQEKKLDIILMPLNLEAIKLIDVFPVRYVDIHSVSFNDKKLLSAIRATGVDIILGVGGRTLNEIDELVQYFKEKLKILMIGYQTFPTNLEDLKMGKIAKLKNLYPQLKIGYADHSKYDDNHAIVSNEYARLLGATVFEKHVTNSEGSERVDAASAVSIMTFKQIIKNLSFIQDFILPKMDDFVLTTPEIKYRNRQASVVATTKLNKNDIIMKEHVALKMTDEKGGIYKIEEVIGKKVAFDVQYDQLINHSLFTD